MLNSNNAVVVININYIGGLFQAPQNIKVCGMWLKRVAIV